LRVGEKRQIAEETRKMSRENSVVAVYHTHTEADQAVKELQRGGVDLHKLSIVGKGYHTDEQVVGYYNTGDRMKYWGKVGAFWGGFWGLLFGSALFIIPGLGPILAAGPVVAWIVAGLEGAVEVGALGALGAGLFSIGIPQGQHREVRNRAQDRSVFADRPWDGCGGSTSKGHHPNYASHRLLSALRG
jgi:uncharacterized membrane protein